MTVLKSITLSSEIKNVVWCSFGKQRTGQSCDKQGPFIFDIIIFVFFDYHFILDDDLV